MQVKLYPIYWRKLLENVFKLVRQNGVQRPKRAFGEVFEGE